jgi:hypothetical protein
MMNPMSTCFNPMASTFCSPMTGLAQQHELVTDLLHDRHRDMRNLSLVNDLIDVRRMETDQLLSHVCGPMSLGTRQPWLHQISHENRQIDNTIKSILRDAKYHRRADEVIANVSLGQPHMRHPNEMVQDLCDLKYDFLARQTAHQLMAQKASRVLETQAQFAQPGAGMLGLGGATMLGTGMVGLAGAGLGAGMLGLGGGLGAGMLGGSGMLGHGGLGLSGSGMLGIGGINPWTCGSGIGGMDMGAGTCGINPMIAGLGGAGLDHWTCGTMGALSHPSLGGMGSWGRGGVGRSMGRNIWGLCA